jgi:hypothetical protein
MVNTLTPPHYSNVTLLFDTLESRHKISRSSPRAHIALEALRKGTPLEACCTAAAAAEETARILWVKTALLPYCKKHKLTIEQATSVAFHDSAFDREDPQGRQVTREDLFWSGQGEDFVRQLQYPAEEVRGIEVEGVVIEDSTPRVAREDEAPEKFGVYRRMNDGGDETFAVHVEDFASLAEAKAVAGFLARQHNVPLSRCPNDPLEGSEVRCVVGMEGGLFRGATCDRPMRVLVYDYSTDGASEDGLVEAPGLDGDSVTVLLPFVEQASVNPETVSRCFDHFEAEKPHANSLEM